MNPRELPPEDLETHRQEIGRMLWLFILSQGALMNLLGVDHQAILSERPMTAAEIKGATLGLLNRYPRELRAAGVRRTRAKAKGKGKK